MPDELPPQHYAIRISIRATLDRADAAAWIAELVGTDIASLWLNGLEKAIANLAEFPYRNAVLPRESRLIGRQTRQLLYRRTRESAAYHAFYTIEEVGEEGPRVIIFHIRHGARRTLSRKEAKEISEAD